MVGDKNKLPDLVSIGDAARCVGENDRTHAQRTHNAHGEGNVAGRVALVEVHPALHHHYRRSPEHACNQAAGMTFNRRLGKVGDRFVGNNDLIVDRIRCSAQSGTQHDTQARSEPAQLGAHEIVPPLKRHQSSS